MLDGKTLVVRKSDPGGTRDTLTLTDLVLVSADEEGAEGQISSIGDIVELIETDTLNDQITALTESTTNSKPDYIPVQQSGTTKKVKTDIILGTPLDRAGLMDASSFARLTDSLCFNPLRARDVNSNPDGNSFHSLKRLGQNETVGMNLSGTKSVTNGKIVGNIGNSNSFAFAYSHKTPSVATARTICELLIDGTPSTVAFNGVLTGNSLVFTSYATGSAVAIPARTLIVGKTYFYVVIYGTSSISIYENNVLFYTATISYDSTFLSNFLLGCALKPALEGVWIESLNANYALTASDRELLYNSGHPDLAVIPDYMKWGNNANIISATYVESVGYFLLPTDDGSTYHSGSGKATKFTGLAASQNRAFRGITGDVIGKKYKATVWTKAGTTTIQSVSIMTNTSTFSQGTFTKEVNPDGSGWDRWTLTYILSDSTSVALTIIPTSSAEGVTYFVDDVSIVQQGVVALYRPAGINIPAVGSLGSTATATVTQYTPYEVVTELTTGERDAVGAVSTSVGTRFVAKAGTTLASTKVKPVYSDTWYDETTNALNATTAGYPGIVLVNKENVFAQGAMATQFFKKQIDAPGSNTGDTTFLPPNWIVTDAVLYNYGTGSVSVKIGSTSGGGEYIATPVSIAAGEYKVFHAPDTKSPFDPAAFSPFYINSASWGSGKIKALFHLKESSFL